MGAPVVGASDGPEALLAGGIPLRRVSDVPLHFFEEHSAATYDLKLHRLAIEVYRADFLESRSAPGDVNGEVRDAGQTHEVDTDGRDVGFRVGVIGEPQEKAGLSNTGVSDEEELEEVVVSADG